MPVPRRRARGFTLVELMVVIAIIGLLATLVTVNVAQQVPIARRARVHSDLIMLRDASNLFRSQVGHYPRSLEELWVAPSDAGRRWQGPYLNDPPPLDPWGRLYEHARGPGGVELKTLGADGAPGGVDDDQDLDIATLRAATARESDGARRGSGLAAGTWRRPRASVRGSTRRGVW